MANVGFIFAAIKMGLTFGAEYEPAQRLARRLGVCQDNSTKRQACVRRLTALRQTLQVRQIVDGRNADGGRGVSGP